MVSTEAAGRPGERARILAADERPEELRFVRYSLGQEYECEFANTLDAAREKLVGLPFHLALCEIGTADERSLVEEIALDHPDTAIVVVASTDDLHGVEHAFRLGACGYLSKPLGLGPLRITVASALRHQQLKQAAREIAVRLASAIEMHNPEAQRHLTGVASVAALLGSKLGFDTNRVALLRAATPMHDIGTVATPDGVLHKRERLTESERERMRTHTTVGYEILVDSETELLRMAGRIALTHHERFDGSGYPQGLRGAEIPMEGRIVAVADVFDALLSDRHHRPAFTPGEAAQLIARRRGTQFDPEVVDALLDNIDEALALRG
ncbi:MAG: HD domain-containing phosphohydrolase [Solirubrobacterales bacterium]